MTSNLRVIYKVDPNRNNVFAFFVTNGSEVRQIGLIEYPIDGQIGLSIKTSDVIAQELQKRIRRSI